MMHDDIERILADEDTITPSARFLPSVMDAVQREAAAPRSLEFPWFRAAPGFVATIAAFAAATWHGIGSLKDPAFSAAFGEQMHELTLLATRMGLHWLLFAVAITMLSVMLPLSLIRAGNSAPS
jgi:hypothetical protein